MSHAHTARTALRLALFVGMGLLVTRLALFMALPLPAPLGDGVLFASVARYHCLSGHFETPIFPLDPSGASRYVWHGIAWPWLLSVLNPGCSLQGGFIGLALVMLATAGALVWGFGSRMGGLRTGLLVLVVGALQAKLGFRPETLAIAIALLGHAWRVRGMAWPWVASLGLLAWTQPTACLLALAHATLTLGASDWHQLRRDAALGLPAVLAIQALLLLAYPFPMADLLAGLAQQGRLFAQRTDGSLFVYFVRSDLFPLIGLAMGLTLAWSAWRRPALLLLLPLIVYFGLRVPPAWYNLAPLFVVMLVALNDEGGQHPQGTREHAVLWITATCALLASVGLAQSLLRDGVSAWRDPTSPQQVVRQANALDALATQVCGVPAWFALMLPAQELAPSFHPTMKTCTPNTPRSSAAVDLVPMSALPERANAAACQLPLRREGVPPSLDRLVRSGSGYGVARCPTLP